MFTEAYNHWPCPVGRTIQRPAEEPQLQVRGQRVSWCAFWATPRRLNCTGILTGMPGTGNWQFGPNWQRNWRLCRTLAFRTCVLRDRLGQVPRRAQSMGALSQHYANLKNPPLAIPLRFFMTSLPAGISLTKIVVIDKRLELCYHLLAWGTG